MAFLTEAQREKAARKYCELLRLNPDDNISDFHPGHEDTTFIRLCVEPRWQIIARDIIDVGYALREALKEADKGVPVYD